MTNMKFYGAEYFSSKKKADEYRDRMNKDVSSWNKKHPDSLINLRHRTLKHGSKYIVTKESRGGSSFKKILGV
jgi:hypothetical protein